MVRGRKAYAMTAKINGKKWTLLTCDEQLGTHEYLMRVRMRNNGKWRVEDQLGNVKLVLHMLDTFDEAVATGFAVMEEVIDHLP